MALDHPTQWALVLTDFKQVTVAAPTFVQGQHAQGQGWTLELSPGWTISRGGRPGSFVVRPN